MRFLYENVKRGVKEKIKEMNHGDRLPAERELADIFEVDRITVRRALKDLEREGYVIKKVGAGTFVNDKNVDEENKVTLIMPTFNTYEHASIYKGIRKYIQDKDIAMELFDCALNKKQEYAYLDYLERCKVNKIIIYPFFKDPITKTYATKLNLIAAKGKKLVVLDQFIPGVNAEFVLFDKYKIIYEMFEYLIGQGHRKILFINGANDNSSKVAKIAYEQIIKDYNLKTENNLYYEIPVKNSSEPVRKLTEKVIKDNVDFTSVVTYHPNFRNAIVEVLKDNNLSKEIISSYNKGYSFEIPKPYFTVNNEKMGQVAIDLLLNPKESEPGSANQKIHYINSKLIF